MKSVDWRRFAAIFPVVILLALIGTGSVSGSGRLTGSEAVAAAQGTKDTQTAALPTASAADEAQFAAGVHPAAKAVTVTLDVLANRHTISPYVYGFAYPNSATDITDTGATEVRWGGDATSTYNWQLETYSSAADYYFEDYAASGFNNGSDASSTQFITDVKKAGGTPLMTMEMLPWVAQSPETSVTQGGTDNYHWSYSVASFGAQCSVDPYNIDAGDGLKTDCWRSQRGELHHVHARRVAERGVQPGYLHVVDQLSAILEHPGVHGVASCRRVGRRPCVPGWT